MGGVTLVPQGRHLGTWCGCDVRVSLSSLRSSAHGAAELHAKLTGGFFVRLDGLFDFCQWCREECMT